MSNWGAVLELRPNVSIVSSFFDSLSGCFFWWNLECCLLLMRHFLCVFSTWNNGYGNSEIFCIFSGLKFYVVQFVGVDNRTFLFGDTDHFAFIWIKFHGTSNHFPISQVWTDRFAGFHGLMANWLLDRQTLLFSESGKSFINARKRQGPRTDPWGTPDMTGRDGDCLPSTTTNWSLLCRKELIHETVFRFTPKLK